MMLVKSNIYGIIASVILWAYPASGVASENMSSCIPLEAYTVNPNAYDGDTFKIRLRGLPDGLQSLSVRPRGYDAPEIRGKCPAEKAQAKQARDYLRHLLSHPDAQIQICQPEWGKYGGRFVANVYFQRSGSTYALADLMISQNLARPYDGGKRSGWCQR